MSWQARLVHGVMRLLAVVSQPSVPKLHAQLAKSSVRPHAPGKGVLRVLDIRQDNVDDLLVYRVQPRDHEPERAVCYLHGGSYLFEIHPFHWRLIQQIAVEARAVVHVPIYRLAPGTTADVTVPAVTTAVAKVLAEHDPESVTLIGDSAGGGLALAVGQHLRDHGASLPGLLVLVAPWLDAAVADPHQRDIEPLDHLLSIPVLQEAGRLYAGPLPIHDYRASPLHGDLSGLPPVEIFTGTHDLLEVDALRLAEKAAASGHALTLHVAPGMQHAYPLLPLVPEAVAARRRIVELCKR